MKRIGGNSDDGDGSALGGRSTIARGFDDYRRLKAERKSNPVGIIKDFAEEAKEKVGAEIGDRWRYKDLWKLEDYSHDQSMGRVAFLLCEAVEQGTQGRHDLATATNILAWKAIHQYVRDRKSWKNAWPLTTLVDPYRPTAWAGNDRELVVVAGLGQAEETLRARLKGQAPPKTGDDAPGSADDKADGGKPKRKPRGKKKDETA